MWCFILNVMFTKVMQCADLINQNAVCRFIQSDKQFRLKMPQDFAYGPIFGNVAVVVMMYLFLSFGMLLMFDRC